MPRMLSRSRMFIFCCVGLLAIAAIRPAAQALSATLATPIDPGGIQLPPEAASANESKFAFIAYGDTRGPADGVRIQAAHRDVVDRILTAIPREESAGFPVR